MRVGIGTSFLALLSLALLLLLLLPLSNAQPPPGAGFSSRALDAILQDCAFKALLSPKTGVPYDSQEVPSNLTGVRVSALRLRSGSLRARGVESYKEFQIPVGVVEQPYVKRLVLVYHNLGNWSENFYPLPGYSYLAPVLGLLAYSGGNLSASELPELDIRASDKPILISFPDVKPAPYGSVSVPKCVYFDLHGSVQFDILLPGNMCFSFQQGHFSIVVESDNASSPSPSPAPAAIAANVVKTGGKNKSKKVWIIAGSLFGGFLLLILLSLLVVRVRRVKKKMTIQELEWGEDSNETLYMTSIGSTKAPLALGTRTRPTIENDYMP